MPLALVKTKWSSGNLQFLDSSGDVIFTIDATNRDLNIPTGSTLTVVDGLGGTFTLDNGYDGAGSGAGRTLTVDNGAVVVASNQAGADALQITEANGAGTGALIDLTHANTAANDVEGTGDAWSVTALGVVTADSAQIGVVKFTEDVLGTGACMIGRDNTGDTTINSLTGKMVHLAVNDVDVVDVAAAAITLAQAVTVSTGGITVTGNSTITGDLTVTGNMTWAAALTVDELVLDTDGSVSGMAGSCYLISDNTGDLTANAITGQEVHLGVNSNDELSVSATEVDIHGNILVLDSDGNTTLDCATGDTIKVYVAGAHDFTITANLFSVLSGSVLNINDGVLFQVGTTGDGVLYHSATAPGANTAIGGVLIGTPVTKDTANNSTYFTNITQDSDMMLAVNDGGHSKGLVFLDGDAGDLYLDSTTTGHIAVAGTDEYTWNATDFIIASGNDIKFAGDDGINDSADNELVRFAAVGSATNYLTIKNSNGGNVLLENDGSTADMGFTFLNDQDEEILVLASAADSVEQVTITSAAAGVGAKIAATTSATDANLVLDTAAAGNIVMMLGGVDALAFHDAGITLAGANDTAGHALYMQTEDGGTDTGASGVAGGAWEVRTGDGSASATAAQVGGAGGALTLVTGVGQTGNTTGNGGVGGAVAVTAGAGGDSGAGAGVGGTGGSLTLTAGAGGGAGGGTAGKPGDVVVGAGILRLKRQTIGMSDVAVTLELTPAGNTLLTGNILYVDAQSSGNEDLLLPPESECDGLLLIIENTGSETINVQNDAAGAIVTLDATECAYCCCDGTTWSGTIGIL